MSAEETAGKTPEVTPAAHVARQKSAKEAKEVKSRNSVVEKWYELMSGSKLVLCKRRKGGSVTRTYVGQIDKKNSASKQLAAHVAVLEKKGQLKRR